MQFDEDRMLKNIIGYATLTDLGDNKGESWHVNKL